jgi:hypothetical protein
MRIGVFLVSLALLATPALVGHAASEESKAKPAARLKLPTNLRGSVPALSPPRSLPPIPPAGLAQKPPAPTATSLPSIAANTGQCRADCAHTYYFCLSGQVNNDCSTTWSQCLVGCSHPPLTIEH